VATAAAIAGAPGAETRDLEVQVLGERASNFRSSVNGLLELLELMCTSSSFRNKRVQRMAVVFFETNAAIKKRKS